MTEESRIKDHSSLVEEDVKSKNLAKEGHMLGDFLVLEIDLLDPCSEDMEHHVLHVGLDHGDLCCLEDFVVFHGLGLGRCIVGCHSRMDQVACFRLESFVKNVKVETVLHRAGAALDTKSVCH